MHQAANVLAKRLEMTTGAFPSTVSVTTIVSSVSSPSFLIVMPYVMSSPAGEVCGHVFVMLISGCRIGFSHDAEPLIVACEMAPFATTATEFVNGLGSPASTVYE